MSNKWKLIIFALGVIIVIIVGIIFSMNDFSKVSNEKDKIVKEEKIKEKEKEKQKPILQLTQDEVEIEVGSNFIFKDFISKAEDEYGYNLKDKVRFNKSIPTKHEGDYLVDYELALPSGKKIVKQLKVSVVEYSTPENPD